MIICCLRIISVMCAGPVGIFTAVAQGLGLHSWLGIASCSCAQNHSFTTLGRPEVGGPEASFYASFPPMSLMVRSTQNRPVGAMKPTPIARSRWSDQAMADAIKSSYSEKPI